MLCLPYVPTPYFGGAFLAQSTSIPMGEQACTALQCWGVLGAWGPPWEVFWGCLAGTGPDSWEPSLVPTGATGGEEGCMVGGPMLLWSRESIPTLGPLGAGWPMALAR